MSSRYRSFRVRTVSTFVLIGSFLGIIWAGHVPLMFMILGIQTMMVKVGGGGEGGGECGAVLCSVHVCASELMDAAEEARWHL